MLDLLLEQRTEPWLVGEIVEEIGSPVAEALEALQCRLGDTGDVVSVSYGLSVIELRTDGGVDR